VKILMTNTALDLRGGSESYLETVAGELRRLGHEVAFFSPVCGEVARRLRATGFEVHETVADLPRDVDVVHGQHTPAVAQVRQRLPRVPLVFATHSWFLPIEDPVGELGAAAYLCFNDVTEQRLRANAATAGADIHRLTQPAEVSFADGRRTPIAPEPRRAVAVSRRMQRVAPQLAEACRAADIRFDWIGGPGLQSLEPRAEMLAADIVFAMGRSALEAMAAARAVVVIDESTYGGWVTHSSYPDLERDGFTGLLTDAGEPALEALLAGYSQDLGSVARRLVVKHHDAHQHAAALVEIYASVADTTSVAVSPGTVGLLVQERYALEARAVAAEWQAAALRRERDELLVEQRALVARLGRLRAKLRRHRRRSAALRAELDAHRGSRRVRRRG
jgi:hypothetical protein